MSAIPMALAQSGPKTPDMQIHIYLDPDAQNNDLDIGVLDINDWPLAKEWIDKWALEPENVQLRDYVELGMMEMDIYHQRWPTGYDPAGFYDASWKHNQSIMVRKAIACLTDRDTIVKDVLKGYGYRLDLPMAPFQGEYTDIEAYRAEGLIYDYNVTRAEEFLDAAGFTMLGSGIRQDPYTPGVEMEPLKFYIRMDDPNRRRAGEMLTEALQSVGVPVDGIITEILSVTRTSWFFTTITSTLVAGALAPFQTNTMTCILHIRTGLQLVGA
jgi:ABC-type transport system substrate-binding protein